jgi:hypothetical protein
MKSIRDYINLVAEAPVQAASGGAVVDSSGNPIQSGTPAPDPSAVAAAKAKLTPSQLKWLGGGDPTDKFVQARMPKPLPGEQAGQAAQPAANANAPLSTPPGAEPDAAPQAAATGLAEPTDADVAAASTPAAPAAVPDGVNPETGEKYDSVANAPLQLPPGAAPEPGMTVAAGAAPAGQAAQPANRDAMPFGKAFADAKAKGEKEFTWKGKKYAVQMAKPAGQAAQPKPAKAGFTTGIAPKVSLPGASQSQNDALSMMAAGNMGAESVEHDNSKVLENNTTGYTELQRILSIVNHK